MQRLDTGHERGPGKSLIGSWMKRRTVRMTIYEKGARRSFSRAVLAGSAVVALVLSGAAPAMATSWFDLTPRSCGSPTATWVYIGATASGTAIHRHRTGTTTTDFTFISSLSSYHYTTAHFISEDSPRIGLNPGHLYNSLTTCDI
jgi:hypothetical protein